MREAERYKKEAISRLSGIHEERQAQLIVKLAQKIGDDTKIVPRKITRDNNQIILSGKTAKTSQRQLLNLPR